MKVNYRLKCFRLVGSLLKLILLYHVDDVVLLYRYHSSRIGLLSRHSRCLVTLLGRLLGLQQRGVRQ